MKECAPNRWVLLQLRLFVVRLFLRVLASKRLSHMLTDVRTPGGVWGGLYTRWHHMCLHLFSLEHPSVWCSQLGKGGLQHDGL